jgi:hypothetical protein
LGSPVEPDVYIQNATSSESVEEVRAPAVGARPRIVEMMDIETRESGDVIPLAPRSTMVRSRGTRSRIGRIVRASGAAATIAVARLSAMM